MKAISRCMWGGGPRQGTSRHVSQQALGQVAGEKDETRAGRGTDPKWFPVASSLLFSLPISLWFLYPQKFQAVLVK